MDTKIYIVESISIFRHTYFVRAKNESDALDEFYFGKDKDSFKEASQKHLDELYTSVREVKEEDFITEFNRNDPDVAECWNPKMKFDCINKIDYREKNER